MKKQLLTTILLIQTIPLLILLGCNSQSDDAMQSKNKILVKTAKVIQQEIALPIHSSGKLSSKEESKLSFKTGGIISGIFVDEGETVKKGQVLAKLNLSEIQAKVNQAKLGLNKAER